MEWEGVEWDMNGWCLSLRSGIEAKGVRMRGSEWNGRGRQTMFTERADPKSFLKYHMNKDKACSKGIW